MNFVASASGRRNYEQQKNSCSPPIISGLTFRASSPPELKKSNNSFALHRWKWKQIKELRFAVRDHDVHDAEPAKYQMYVDQDQYWGVSVLDLQARRANRWGRSGKLDRARSRLYPGQILQQNMRLKALAEIYTMHSFAQLCNLIFLKNDKKLPKDCEHFQKNC